MATMPGQEFASWTSVPKLRDVSGSLPGALLALGLSKMGVGSKGLNPLESMGISKSEEGKWQFKPVQGAAVPTEGQANFMGPVVPPQGLPGIQPVAQPTIQAPTVAQPMIEQPTLPSVYHPDVDDAFVSYGR